ncbi:pollen-specific leucine-rich repeat extensin-like protein 2 [Humulus lupulus]|uniref:pollen-specific leucine-rich repeat extensin-like protein 2 n=1 Tax=Humulus lupulus TaxID=3486 RepID=UPI002B415BC4|nr:pollen-specific leucine-rich repeat extensin-like protein 2 [Humulus lupulus]
MKIPSPPKNVDAPKEPTVPGNEREASSPTVQPDENHPRSAAAPVRDAGELPPPRPPWVPNSGRQDPSPSMRKPGKSHRVHSISSRRKEKGPEGGETTIPMDDGRTRLSTSNTPRTKQREHPGKAKQPQGPEQKNNANPHNDAEVTSREVPPDLREKLNRRRSEVRTTPPVPPSKGR